MIPIKRFKSTNIVMRVWANQMKYKMIWSQNPNPSVLKLPVIVSHEYAKALKMLLPVKKSWLLVSFQAKM